MSQTESKIITIDNIATQLGSRSYDDPSVHAVYHPEVGDLALGAVVPEVLKNDLPGGPLMLSFIEKHRYFCPECNEDFLSLKRMSNPRRKPLSRGIIQKGMRF